MIDTSDSARQERRAQFGERVRELRLSQQLSQEALADRADLHRTYVGSVERGERNISLDAIWSLADALSVDARSLFEKDQPASPQ